MKNNCIFLVCIAPCLAFSQSGVYAYLPAQNGFLPLKSVKVDSTVMGPIVRTRTDFTYERPRFPSSEVSFNFELPQSSVLAGFGLIDGAGFVPGRLQFKGGVAQVNTDFGNGLRESGLMDSSAPSVFRCEIVPPNQSGDLRIRVWAVGLVQPVGREMVVQKPPVEVSGEPTGSNWTIRGVSRQPIQMVSDHYSLGPAGSIRAVAQKFRNGRYYVAGYFHTNHAIRPSIEIDHAYYEPKSGGAGGVEVTAKIQDMLRRDQYFVWASDVAFGDPSPNIDKRLRVIARIAGQEKTMTISENETMNLLGQGGNSVPPLICGPHEAKTVFEDPGTVGFYGWTTHPGLVTATFQGHRYRICPDVISDGPDAARLWAQQVLATHSIDTPEQVLGFSLDYGILSNVTALVAVSKSAPVSPLIRPSVDVLPVPLTLRL